MGVALLVLALLAAYAGASHQAIPTQGHTTVEKTIVAISDPNAGYTDLAATGPGEPYILRDVGEDPAIPAAQSGRQTRRTSLAYFSQLTDFQLADEESPARVEFLDPGASAAHRPQEGFTAFQMEATVRQINDFAAASPIAAGDGSRNAMDFALITGDQVDNMHLNETVWVRDLLEGTVNGDPTGRTDFNSGVIDPAFYADPANLSASCAAYVGQEGSADAAAAEAARYTGVQDYDDYPVSPPLTPLYYDPDDPTGDFADWPEYDGVLDRAQQLTINPTGLAVPFYVTNGNHDVLVQGNEDANAAFEGIALNCFKALGTTNSPSNPDGGDGPNPLALLSPANVGMLVAPDPRRRFVSKPQIKEVYGANNLGPGDDDHGFAYVDPQENTASNGSASYYAWDPQQTPGLRFISIDTNSEGGQTAEGVAPGSSNGNIDDPQFQWLRRELVAAAERNQIVVIFGHHPVRSMNAEIRDEQAAPCSGGDDGHGHDPNPGCDLDPRPSDDDPATPGEGCLHNGTDAQNNTCSGGDAAHVSFEELINQFPNVVAYVPGHTHEHRLTPFIRSNGTVWWEVNTSAVIDYPNQSRLVELMDNRDGTLSIFNTVVDHASPATSPADCPDDATPPDEPDCGAGFTEPQLASIGRTLTFNDPDNDFSGDGRIQDRNAELLVEDPRPVADLSIQKTESRDPVRAGERFSYTLAVTNNGPGESVDTTVVDRLPAGVQPTAAFSASCTVNGREVTCDFGTVPSGATRSLTIPVAANAPGTVTNEASVTGNVSDRNPQNNSTAESTQVLPAFCFGQRATIVAVENRGVTAGTAGKDVIVGSPGSDLIRASGGDDLICGNGSPDRIESGAGNDVASGDGASDRIYGGRGNDRGFGGARADILLGGAGADRMFGQAHFDNLRGGPGRDRLAGGIRADVLRGNAGPDRLRGNFGDDKLYGGRGRDTLRGGPGKDVEVQ